MKKIKYGNSYYFEVICDRNSVADEFICCGEFIGMRCWLDWHKEGDDDDLTYRIQIGDFIYDSLPINKFFSAFNAHVNAREVYPFPFGNKKVKKGDVFELRPNTSNKGIQAVNKIELFIKNDDQA